MTTFSIETPNLGQPDPHDGKIADRIKFLAERYLSLEHLGDRLEDLSSQFAHPRPRPWQPIDWQAIDPSQIVGINLEVFLSILVGAINTEAPIRGYTQTSRQYLIHLHPQLADFVGGVVTDQGTMIEPGLWEKEERQHSPALMKVYTCLSGQKITASPHVVRGYRPSSDLRSDLYRHGLHRVATEYGASCLYLWLMAHTTGALQAVLAELAVDEINHMSKFWGFGVWAFPESSLIQIGKTLLQSMKGRLAYSRDRSSLIGTLRRMSQVLNWNSWSWTNRVTFAFTCTYVLHRLWRWNRGLTPAYLQSLFGPPMR